MKQKLLKQDFEDGFHARLVKEKPDQISNPVGYSCGQIHAKIACDNYKLLEPYRSGPSQILRRGTEAFTSENDRG